MFFKYKIAYPFHNQLATTETDSILLSNTTVAEIIVGQIKNVLMMGIVNWDHHFGYRQKKELPFKPLSFSKTCTKLAPRPPAPLPNKRQLMFVLT